MPDSLAADPFIVLFVLLFLGIMAAAAIYDLVTYTIPHFAPVLLTGMFIIFALWQGLSWPVLIDHAGVGIAMLIAGWALFAFGLMGGGDVKLFAATSLWMGWSGIVNYVIMFSICGGVLALVLLLFRRLPLPVCLSRHGWVAVLHNEEQGVPYGIALTIGAILAWPHILALPSM